VILGGAAAQDAFDDGVDRPGLGLVRASDVISVHRVITAGNERFGVLEHIPTAVAVVLDEGSTNLSAIIETQIPKRFTHRRLPFACLAPSWPFLAAWRGSVR
jgi:hypothetical protein